MGRGDDLVIQKLLINPKLGIEEVELYTFHQALRVIEHTKFNWNSNSTLSLTINRYPLLHAHIHAYNIVYFPRSPIFLTGSMLLNFDIVRKPVFQRDIVVSHSYVEKYKF